VSSTSVFLAGLLLLTTCQVDSPAETREVAPLVRPAPPRLECATGGPARAFDGAFAALASNAVAVLDADGSAQLHRLDEPSAPIPLPAPVMALAWRGGRWLLAGPGYVGEVDESGETLWQVEIDIRAVDAAMSVEGDRAWLVARDAEDEVSVSQIDLRARTAAPAISVGRGRGRLLVAPGRASFAAPDAPVWTVDEPLETAGTPVALVGSVVVFERDASTGLWAGEPPSRLSRSDITPGNAVAAALGERVLVAYWHDGDLFIQPAAADEGALGEPLLIAPDASPSAIATTGERFWVAWERGQTVEVRAGDCEGG